MNLWVCRTSRDYIQHQSWYLERSLLPGVALATMLVKPILYLAGSESSCMWLSSSSVKPDRNRHFPARGHRGSLIRTYVEHYAHQFKYNSNNSRVMNSAPF